MKKQGFLKGSAILMIMVIVTKILGLMYKIPLTRMLGGSGMGYYSSAYAVFTPIFSAVVSGIPSTVSRMTAENYALGRYANVRKIKKCAVLLFGFMATICTLGVILSSKFLAENVIHEKYAMLSLVAIAPSSAFVAVMSAERGYYEGLRNMLPTAVSEVVETVFKLILGLGFASATMNYAMRDFEETHGCFGQFCRTADDARMTALPYVSASSILGVSLASGIASLYIIISGKIHGDGINDRMLKSDPVTDKASSLFSLLLKNAFPIALATVITTFSNMIDLITVKPCLKIALEKSPDIFKKLSDTNSSVEALPNFVYGSYTGLALTVFGLVPTLTAMFGKSILPSLAEAWVKNDKKSVRKNLTAMLWITSLIAVPSGIGISLLSREALEFLYSGRTDEIAVSAQALSILGAGVIFMGISIPCFSAIQTIGRQRLPVIIMLAGGGVKLALNLLLIPIARLNILGASISTVVSQAVICVWAVVAMIKYSGISVSLRQIFLKPLFAGLLCGISARLCCNLTSRFNVNGVISRLNLIFSIAIGIIIYVISLYLLCVLPKNQIKAVFGKKN